MHHTDTYRVTLLVQRVLYRDIDFPWGFVSAIRDDIGDVCVRVCSGVEKRVVHQKDCLAVDNGVASEKPTEGS